VEQGAKGLGAEAGVEVVAEGGNHENRVQGTGYRLQRAGYRVQGAGGRPAIQP
jgi:hypothetical protein